MTRRIVDALKALAALALVLLLVIGVPIALAVVVGWPLPSEIPTASSVREALGAGGVDAVFVAKSIAIVIWFAWLHVASAFVLEVVALVRRRPAFALPGMGGLQQQVARLVTTVTLLGAALAPARATAAPPLPLYAIAAVAQQTPAPVVSAPVRTAPAPVAPTYEVQRHDSLWSIAEDRLGDGFRWREIRDVNVGRVMPDGALVDGTSDVIRPGWVLELPHDTPPSTSGPASEVVAERGESLWSLAEETAPAALGHEPTPLEVADHWRAMIDMNRDRLIDPDDPGLIIAGQAFVVPSGGEPAVPPPAVVDPPVTSIALPTVDRTTPAPDRIDAAPAEAPPAGASADDDRSSTSDDEQTSTGRLGVAAAALAVGVSAEVLRRRRRRTATSQGAALIAAPPPELDKLRVALALDADVDLIERRNGALRALGHVLAKTDFSVRPRVVQVTTRHVEVLLTRPLAPAPAPWTVQGGGQVWTTAEDLRVADGCDPAPALVALGSASDGAHLFIDLESAGVLAVTGDGGEMNLVRSAVTELGASTFAQRAEVVLVGDDGRLGEESLWEWVAVADELLARAVQTRDYLQANRWRSAHEARIARGIDDATAPVVVVLADVPDDDRFDELCEIVTGGMTAISIVVLGRVDAGLAIDVRDGVVRVPALDLMCPAQMLAEEVAVDVDALIADAADGQLTLLDGAQAVLPVIDLRSAPAQRPDVVVRLLGEIDVVGGRRPLTPKQIAVMAYIALHAPVVAERVEDAVWPNGTMASRKRLANTVSDCRSALGSVHLPIAADGRYTVGPGVGTDLQTFEHLVALAASAEAEDKAAELLRSALSLVRGPVFSYRSSDRDSWVWLDLENWMTTWELKVVNAALDLSALALDLNDIDMAVWAAEQGLVVSSLHAGLVEALMRAYWRRGDSEAAERAYQSHVAALEEIDGDTVADTTLDLRDQIKADRSA